MESDEEKRNNRLNPPCDDPEVNIKPWINNPNLKSRDENNSLHEDLSKLKVSCEEYSSPETERVLTSYNSTEMTNMNNNYKSNNGILSSKEDETIGGGTLDPKKLTQPIIDPENSERGDKSKKKGTRAFLLGVKKDLMNKDLLSLKILFFFKYATLFVLYPFMPLHLKSLGLTTTEAGINSALVPIVVILCAPFSGMIADKIGNFKIYLTVLTVLNAPLALVLLLVPMAREIIHLPEMMTFNFSCESPVSNLSSNHTFVLQTIDTSTCQFEGTNDTTLLDWNSFTSSTLQCGQVCLASSSTTKDLPIFGESNQIHRSDVYRLPDNKSIFIPYKNKKPQLICSSSTDCTFDIVELQEPYNNYTEDLSISIKIRKLRLLDATSGNLTEPKFVIEDDFIIGEIEFKEGTSPQCGLGLTSSIQLSTNDGTCRNECLVTYKRKLICTNRNEEKIYDVGLTFGLYTLFRVLLGVASATSFIMFEGAVIAILKEFGGDYGLQRVTATMAAIIFAPLAGLLIQIFHNFYPAFYLYAILQVISGLLTLKIDLRFKPPTEKILGHLKEVLTQIEILIFFCAMFLSGSVWGYLESFLFWFLEDLKASNTLMGLTISVGGLFGIPVLIFSRPIIKRVGHVNVLCLGLVFYSLRLVGYSYIENPWLCLPFEAMESITASLALTAATTYAAALSSTETIASIQGIWGGLYFGVGRGAGSLTGGFFHKWYGARYTFRIFALMSLIVGIIYFIINMLYIERYSKFHRKIEGVNMNDIKGEKYRREKEAAAKQSQNNWDDSTNTKCDGGYIGPCDVNNFTDIPLDEDTPQLLSKVNHNVTEKTHNGNNISNSNKPL